MRVDQITVEVVCAQRDRQALKSVRVRAGATLIEAVRASGLLDRCPGLDEHGAMGVFGRRCGPDTPLREGDRVELYRPLNADPKERRRQRAARR